MPACAPRAPHPCSIARHVLTVGVVALAALLLRPDDVKAADVSQGLQVYKEANCVGCHKWHGGGGGGYGGAALSLRETGLDRAGLIEAVRCGRPATRMPYHDRSAYRTTDCYGGTTRSNLGEDFPPTPEDYLREEEIEAVADYVLAEVQGKGEPTYEDCIAFWGEGEKQCEAMKN
jgi:mono/diheme cytochrome c family protein